MRPTTAQFVRFAVALLVLIACIGVSSGVSAGDDSCLDCHAYMSRKSQQIVAEWKDSIHAKNGITCVSCHGGNPKSATIDGAMWKSSNFKGAPKKRDIPALCAKCHSDPNYMRPYNISSTSQFAEYKQSVHGKRLLEQGDMKVAVCTDCHGTHGIRAKDDVKSSVYKINIADTCAKCHSDKEYMKQYGIPTDQYEKYVKSYHGYKLLKEQDKAAPACTDCHGTHGATPPGVKEVPSVCGTCHSRTLEYFASGPHGSALKATGSPRCVSCHSNHEIVRPSDDMLIGDMSGHCGSCHPAGSSAHKQALAIHKEIVELEKAYSDAIEALDTAEAANMDMQDQVAELEGAKTNLIAARALQHTVTPEKVAEAVKEASLTITSVTKSANTALQKSHMRNRALLLCGLAIVFTCIVLFWKWRLAYRRWCSEACREQ